MRVVREGVRGGGEMTVAEMTKENLEKCSNEELAAFLDFLTLGIRGEKAINLLEVSASRLRKIKEVNRNG